MSDDLRSRIAAALCDAALVPMSVCDAEVLADAVIRELGLKREELGGFRVPGYGHRGHRYVTAWVADE